MLDVSCFDSFSSLEVQYRDLAFLFVASIAPFRSKIFPLSAEEVAIVIEMKLILIKLVKSKPTIERTANNLHLLYVIYNPPLCSLLHLIFNYFFVNVEQLYCLGCLLSITA